MSAARRVLIISTVVERSELARDILREHGFEMIPNPAGAGLDRSSLLDVIREADAAIVGIQPIDDEVLAAGTRLRFVLKAGVGVDNLDLDSAARRGIATGSMPGVNADAVADYAVGMMLAVGRRLLEADRCVREGRWERFPGVDLYGRTLGIIGFGNVGRRVAQRVSGFDMKVLAYDPQFDASAAQQRRAQEAELDDLLGTADFVTLHLPLLQETRNLLDRDRLALMKSSAVLINTSRGGLVDEAALYDALASGRLRGAGLDVFAEEPLKNLRLAELPNVLLSPHNASYGEESLRRVAVEAAERVVAFFETGAP
jgi:D-3-phosphoglycerate dehydrogenase